MNSASFTKKSVGLLRSLVMSNAFFYNISLKICPSILFIGDKAGKSATVEYLDHEVETENVARFNLEEMTIVNMLITNTSSK